MVEKSNRYETFRIIKFRICFLHSRSNNFNSSRSKLRRAVEAPRPSFVFVLSKLSSRFSFPRSEILYPLDFPFLDPKFPRNGSVTRRANNVGFTRGVGRGRSGRIKEGVEMEGTVIKRLRERSFSRSFRHPSPPIFKSLLMARTHASFARVPGEKLAKSAPLSLSFFSSSSFSTRVKVPNGENGNGPGASKTKSSSPFSSPFSTPSY